MILTDEFLSQSEATSSMKGLALSGIVTLSPTASIAALQVSSVTASVSGDKILTISSNARRIFFLSSPHMPNFDRVKTRCLSALSCFPVMFPPWS